MVSAIQTLAVSCIISLANAQSVPADAENFIVSPATSVATNVAEVVRVGRELDPEASRLAEQVHASLGPTDSSPVGLASPDPAKDSAPEPLSILAIGVILIVLAMTARRWRKTLVS